MSSERTQLVELRALGSTGSSAEGALGDVPEPDELVDFGSAVIPGRRTSPTERPLRCGRRITVPLRTLLCRGVCYVVRGGGVFFLPVEVGPGFPWGSLVFLLVPSRPLSRLLGGGTPRAGQGIPAGQRPVALVGVTGFELAASSSRTTSKALANRH